MGRLLTYVLAIILFCLATYLALLISTINIKTVTGRTNRENEKVPTAQLTRVRKASTRHRSVNKETLVNMKKTKFKLRKRVAELDQEKTVNPGVQV